MSFHIVSKLPIFAMTGHLPATSLKITYYLSYFSIMLSLGRYKMEMMCNQDLKSNTLEKSSFLKHIHTPIFPIYIPVVYHSVLLHTVQIKR